MRAARGSVPKHPGRARWIFTRMALTLGSLLLVAAVLELGLRVTHNEAEPRIQRDDPDLPELALRDLRKRNIRGTFKGSYYRTNSEGLRGPEYLATPARDIYRIGLAGDSFTMGSGVKEEDTYASVLTRLLNPSGRPKRFEVMNLGLAGSNARSAIDWVFRTSENFRFHLAVYGWTLNDIQDTGYRHIESSPAWRNYWTDTRRFMNSPSIALRTLWPRWMSLRERLWPRLGGMYEEIVFNYEQNPEAWAEFVAQLDRLAAFAREHRICGHVFLHTQLTRLGPDHALLGVYDRVATAARERGLSVTSSFPSFEGRRDVDLWVNLYDSHPNVEGHAILGRALYEGLMSDLPMACWSVGLDAWPPPVRRG